ncbi:MAG: septal ring lytic transglycosylase RlpA family protein [Polyangiaceae bacterium]
MSKRHAALVIAIACSMQSLSCAHNTAENRGFSAPANTRADSSSSSSSSGDDMLHDTAANAQGGGVADSKAQVGLATWYGAALAGHKTASGERFDPTAMTAAHRKLKLGTWVEVKRVDTGSSVRVRINDRGPWGDDRRIIDLSRAAAEKLGIVHDGVARVEVRVVSGPE